MRLAFFKAKFCLFEKYIIVQESRVWVVKLYLVIHAKFFHLRFLYYIQFTIPFTSECYFIGVFTSPIHLCSFHKLCFVGIHYWYNHMFLLQTFSCNSYFDYLDSKLNYYPTRRGGNSKMFCFIPPPPTCFT